MQIKYLSRIFTCDMEIIIKKLPEMKIQRERRKNNKNFLFTFIMNTFFYGRLFNRRALKLFLIVINMKKKISMTFTKHKIRKKPLRIKLW